MDHPPRVQIFSAAIAAVILASVCARPLFGEDVPNTSATTEEKETVMLSPFEVSTRQTGRYQSTEATSGGRVRTDVFEAPQSVSIITRELIDDVGADRILDAAKYVSAITESTFPTSADRTTVRGFQIDGTTVDGFAAVNQTANLDPILAERLEVVKGPNAILAPTGVAGGTVNLVTRKPKFRNFGAVHLQVGRYDANRAELDFNRVFGRTSHFALRLLLARQQSEGYVGNEKRNTTFLPMLSLRTKGGAQLTVQFEYFDFFTQTFFGVPVDPASSSTNDVRLLRGIRRDLNHWDEDFRIDERKEGRVFFTTPLSDTINLRLALRYASIDTNFTQEIPGLNMASNAGNNAGGAINPRTGLYEPGSIFGAAPAFAALPAPAAARTLPRAGQWFHYKGPAFNLQNDYVHQLKHRFIETTTLGGFAYTYNKESRTNFVANTAPINYDAPARSTYTLGAMNTRSISTINSQQLYLAETGKFVGGRVALSGSYSYNNFDLAVVDRLTTVIANQRTIANVDTQLKAYGSVVKPIPSVALFWGYSEAATTLSAGVIAAGGPPLQTGNQTEYGIRFEAFEKRLLATLAHFKIDQSNFSIPNPGNLTVPPPVPLLPMLLADRVAKGWEFEVRASLTRQFSLIGNLADFTNRDPNNVPFRGTAEKSWAFLANYRFSKTTPLDGFSLTLGLEHLGRRPGDAPGGITAASTPTNVIPNQPTFWLPEHTLVNLAANYPVNQNWSVQLNVANLLDEDYFAAAISRTQLMVGTPRNARIRLSYRF
jgi:iron complex outermembrane receptor protein